MRSSSRSSRIRSSAELRRDDAGQVPPPPGPERDEVRSSRRRWARYNLAMLAALDVHYPPGGGARAACVCFEDWEDAEPSRELLHRVDDVAPYEPGVFYKRELPSLLAVLATAPSDLTCVVIDGYVWLGGEDRAGLGAHLFRALGERIAVIGVAKTKFAREAPGSSGAPPFRLVEVLRGTSAKPLFVTAAGRDPELAAANIRRMHGANRLPTLLKRADQLCRA